ncbi:hypothetical protein [Dyadobacter sp. Leaf189]|uniref:hypothetical protein n=1 Tax=Dyadobacter sp. Leaf189 TaxID=1736295 RepID=UPI0006FFB6FB|nr:hypothetical protein [Dyadobacter sp. Leaf189]
MLCWSVYSNPFKINLAVLTLGYRWLIQFETFSKLNRALLCQHRTRTNLIRHKKTLTLNHKPFGKYRIPLRSARSSRQK